MRYVSFLEYESLCGKPYLTKYEWEQYEPIASYYLDRLTYNRINPSALTDEVKLTICGLTELFFEENKALDSISKTVKSFNNDGYSETSYSPDNIRKRFDADKLRIVGLYIPRSHPLRYAGI